MIKLLFICFGGTILSAFFVIQPADQRSWVEHHEAGEKAMQFNNPDLAKKQFEAALQIARVSDDRNDQLVTTLHSLGTLALSQNHHSEAATYLREALKRLTSEWGQEDPIADSLRRELARCYERSDDWQTTRHVSLPQGSQTDGAW